MLSKTRRPSPALIVAIVALVAALAGSAIALPGKNSVKKNDIAKGAVTKKAIKKGAVKAKALGTGAVTNPKIADGAVDGAKVADGSLSTADLSNVYSSGLKKVTATEGADFDAARDAAPQQVLLSRGPLSVYGKCFTDTGSDTTYAYVYAATTQAGSALVSGYDYLIGDPDFLDPSTDEDDREISDESAAGNDSADGWRNLFALTAPDGTSLQGSESTLVKNGDLTNGNGLYGTGDVCFFQAQAMS